jgi:two-component system cell cycle response regulator
MLEREQKTKIQSHVAAHTKDLMRQLSAAHTHASRDTLTGLLNRRTFDDELSRLMSLADAQPLCVLAVDVDHFKHLNDTLGHAAGDEFLKKLAELLKSATRGSDLCYRTGGDEFVLLMPGSSAREASAVADRLARLVEQIPAGARLSKKPGLSIGVVVAYQGETPAGLLARADAEAYRVKSARKAARTAA